jgi:hypothetical protein
VYRVRSDAGLAVRRKIGGVSIATDPDRRIDVRRVSAAGEPVAVRRKRRWAATAIGPCREPRHAGRPAAEVRRAAGTHAAHARAAAEMRGATHAHPAAAAEMRGATHAHPAAAADMGCAAHPHSTSATATEMCAAASAEMCAAASDSCRGRIRSAGKNGRYGNDGEELGF